MWPPAGPRFGGRFPFMRNLRSFPIPVSNCPGVRTITHGCAPLSEAKGVRAAKSSSFLLPAPFTATPMQPDTDRCTRMHGVVPDTANFSRCGVKTDDDDVSLWPMFSRRMMHLKIPRAKRGESVARRVPVGFFRSMQIGRPHIEQRTSCVLFNRASFRMLGCTTRLQGGFAPVDPHQRGDWPPLLDSPLRDGRSRS